MRHTCLLGAAVLLPMAAAPTSGQAQQTRPDPGIGGVIEDVRETTGGCLRTLRIRRVLEPGVDQRSGVRALPIRPGIGRVIVCVTAETEVRAMTGRDSTRSATSEDLVRGRLIFVHHTGFFRPTKPPLVTATRIFVGRGNESPSRAGRAGVR